MQNLIYAIVATEGGATCHLIGATTDKTDAAELANSARAGNNFQGFGISVLAVRNGRIFSDRLTPQTARTLDGVDDVTDELR